MNEDYAVGRFFLARALLATGDLAGAEREARRGLDLDAKGAFTPLAHYVLADVYSRQGRAGDAAREAELGREAEARTAPSGRSAPADGSAGTAINPSP